MLYFIWPGPVALNIQTVAIALMVVLTGLASAICGGSGQLSVHQEIQQAARNGVEELNLSNRGLISLPSEIGQLTTLTNSPIGFSYQRYLTIR